MFLLALSINNKFRRQTYRKGKCKSTGGYFNKLVQASSLTGVGVQCIPVDVMVSIISAWVWQTRRNAILTGMPHYKFIIFHESMALLTKIQS